MFENNTSGANSLPLSVEVKCISEEKGRGLFATKSFESDDEIFEEYPLVCCQLSWNVSCGYKACEFCMKPLETAEDNARRLTGDPNLKLPVTTELKDVETQAFCPRCLTEYCSAECMIKAENLYHITLCTALNESHPLVRLNDAWKQMHYPPETSTIMIIPKILAMLHQQKETTEKFGNFCQKAYSEQSNLIHKFLGEKYAEQVTLLHDLVREAVGPEVAKPISTVEEFQSLIAMLATNGQGVGTSAFSVWVENSSSYITSNNPDFEKDFEEIVDKLYEDMDSHTGLQFLNNEGVALYKLQSMINHNCEPNAYVSFKGNDNKLILRAKCNIKEGEEICISYLDECMLERSRHSRQKELSQNYLFICRCAKCAEQASDPDLTSDEEDNSDDCADMHEN